MNFQQFCFADEHISYWNKPSPSHDSTLMESNDIQVEQSGQNSDSERQKGEQRIPPTIKLIRKKYDPIKDGDQIIRFEDNPTQYRKARKKLQNRLSATKVRGKKKTHLEEIEGQVCILREKNSELQLSNAKLQAQNNMLRERVNFLEKVVLTKNHIEADSYVSISNPSASPQTVGSDHTQQKSPFENIEDSRSVWSRASSSSKMSKQWMTLTIFTIMLAVMVIPSTKGTETAMIAAKINLIDSIDREWLNIINSMYKNTIQLEAIKWYIKVGSIFAYVVFVGCLLIRKIVALRVKKIK